jgi:hypothetical protein
MAAHNNTHARGGVTKINNMAAAVMNEAVTDHFPLNARFYSLFKAVKKRRKMTKKSIMDDISSLGLFSGKGHLIWSRIDTALTPALRAAFFNDIDDQIEGRIISVYILGGMHPRMPLTATAGTIFLYTFHVLENDIKVFQVSEKKCSGAQINMRPFIHSAAVVDNTATRVLSIGRRRAGLTGGGAALKTTVFIWGGIDPNAAMTPHNDLTILETYGLDYTAKLIGISDTVSVQTGSIPSPRYGHTLTSIHNKGQMVGAILYGGVECSDGEKHATEDGKLYWLGLGNTPMQYQWEEIKIQGMDELAPVAFHTGAELWDGTVVYIGGLSQVQVPGGRTVFNRQSILDVSIIHCHLPQTGQQISAEMTKLKLSFSPESERDIFLSGHTVNVCNPRELLIYGGYQQSDNETHSSTPSGRYFVVNIETALIKCMDAPLGFEMASHTSLHLDSSSVFFHGGANQHLFTLTTKRMEPGKCEAESCVVDSEYSPGELVTTLQCNKCDKWFHACCTELRTETNKDNLENIDFICDNCKPKKTKRGRKKQK